MKTEVRNEFILEAHKSACSEWKLKIEKECPELFKSKLEVGKWYKQESSLGNDFIFIFIKKREGDKIHGFGFKGNGDWFENDFYWTDGIWTLATKEEVKEALIKEAKKRGFKEGVKYISVGECEGEEDILHDFNLRYGIGGEDALCCYGSNRIYCKGKWAEIISNPIEEKIKEIEANIENVVKEAKKQIEKLKKQL